MENLELTPEEKKELEKRGFFVKRNLVFNEFLKLFSQAYIYIISSIIFYIVPWYMLIAGIGTLFIDGITGKILIIGGSIMAIFGAIYILVKGILGGIVFYLKSGMEFYGNNGKVISFGKILSQTNGLNAIKKFNQIMEKFYKGIDSASSKTQMKAAGYLFLILIAPFFIALAGGFFGIFIGVNIGIYVLFEIFRRIFQSYHPLYAFGNLGEKIQSLTPQIEEKSKQIQSEFQSDMNFSILSNRFNSLTVTFSSIVTLVIKLEKVEARASKGNLFDSEKYINSLRSDIVTPLTSLKVFLEKQKTELMKSEKELTRVRVGGNESTGNVELQSKRSESLIQELTENIEKLDMMIGKMG